MTKDELKAAIGDGVPRGKAVKILPADGSQWALWRHKGTVNLRRIVKPSTLEEAITPGGGSA